ncbi:TRP-domain-containing protein [Flagelloscypha sp. PMI_526]|nr:TRP-domain-containing protein [Flagelloscypha sp. PMI_526]
MSFSLLAGLRALFFFIISFSYAVNARDLTLCALPYENNLNVSANVLLNAYGMKPLNITIDFCTILGGALCPLPKYHFKGSQTLQLPDTVDTSVIPGIAYYVPDFEGFAQLMLTDTATGDLKACVQATLANGQSMKQPAVSWATGASTFIVFLLALWQSLSSPYAVIPVRLLDLMHLYQGIVTSAFLSLNYPLAYRAFTLNFAWALGFITGMGEQTSIDRMRSLTGGSLANSTSSSVVEQINRKTSPYNVRITDVDLASISTFSKSLLATTFASADSIFGGNSDDDGTELSPYAVQTVTEDGSNILPAGLPVFVNSIHIGTANAFMTAFFALLVLAAIYGGVVLCAVALSMYQQRRAASDSSFLQKVTSTSRSFVASWGIRLLLVVSFPIFTLAMYQWTLKDSWLSILLSVITFIVVLCGLAYSWYRIGRLVKQYSPQMLHSDKHFFSTFGSPIYSRYHVEKFYFAAVLVVAFLLKSIFIAAAKGHGATQLGLFLAVEIGTLSLGVAAIPRLVIGLVIAVIFSVSILVILINVVVHVFDGAAESQQWSDSSSIEQGEKPSSSQPPSSPSSSSQDDSSHASTDRPKNPTPDQHVILDPEVNQPYPTATPVLWIRWSFSWSPLQSTRPSPQSDNFTTSQSHAHSHSDNST